jgi:hypothetical protein
LTDEQLFGLIASAPILYHTLAALGEKCVAAFLMYFPPPNPQKPVEPAKVN